MDEKNKRCVFCGEAPGMFARITVACGPTIQFSCKACARELESAPEEELCRRALRLGLAEYPNVLEERLALITGAENARPACLRCGTKLKFKKTLQGSSFEDTAHYANVYGAIPATCSNCGKMEFYDLRVLYENPALAHLIKKDTES